MSPLRWREAVGRRYGVGVAHVPDRMTDWSASQSRTADFASVSSTGLQVEGRAADHLEHVGGGGLLLQRFAQLVEQAGVLDGDDGLVGEVLQQRNLLVGERPHFLAVDA